MIRRLINWVKARFGYSSAIGDIKIVKGEETKVQTTSKDVVISRLTNEIDFHNSIYKSPLTINALVHGGTLKQRDFMRNCINVLRHIVVSEIFQDAALDHAPFYDTLDNPLEIYKKFISGKDLYDQFEDREMDVDLTIYYRRWSSTVGYTYPNTRKTYINMRHFNTHEFEMMAKVIGNIVHEYMHNIGYGHTSYWSKYRATSVPYAYGYMARDLALEFLGSGRDIAKFEEIYKNVESN